jgi:hypothetical protein
MLKNRGAAFALVALFVIAGYGVWLSSYEAPQHQTINSFNQGPAKSVAPEPTDEKIAIYTEVLAWFTGVLALISLVQIAFLFRADNTARIAANAARATVNSMDDTAQKQLRAYVGIFDILLECKNLTVAKYEPKTEIIAGTVHDDFIVITMKNFGSTPANQARMWVNWYSQKFGERLPKNFKWGDYDSVSKGEVHPIFAKTAIFPGQTIKLLTVINDLTPFRGAIAKMVNFYIYGHIDYVDIYEANHTTTFCYHYSPWRPVGDQFMPYEEYNEAQ